MIHKRSILACLLVVAGLCGTARFASADDSADDVKKKIAELHKEFVKALSEGNAAAIARQCTEKARLMPPNQEVVDGRDRIQAYWQAVIEVGVKSAALETTEVEVSGDIAYETGTYKVFGLGQQQLDQGKYLVVWKKDGGIWKTHRDCWNSNEKRSE